MRIRMTESTLIRIPTSRARQLRALARVRKTTMTELIDEYVARAILDRQLPDETPGLTLTRLGSGDFEIQIGNERYFASSSEAQTLFRWLGEDKIAAASLRKFGSLFRSLELRKAGTALVLEIKRNGKSVARFSMTGSITTDVRRQIAAAYRDDHWLSQYFKN
jgi:hypothetical protein